jgi:hypothetical protein
MADKTWMFAPPKTIRRPRTCPSGRAYFSTVDLAQQALTAGLGAHGLTAVECGRCGGAHHTTTIEETD